MTASSSDPLQSSEAYRQALVRDGQRRFEEWHENYHAHCRRYRSQLAQRRIEPTSNDRSFIPSEAYRQALVRDGQRRFEEWHDSFLDYQRQFLQQQKS